GWRRHGCNAGGELQSMGITLLAGDRQDGGWRFNVSRQESPEPRRSATALHAGKQLVFERERKERRDCAGSVGGLRRTYRRLFLRTGGTDQRNRICSHRRGRKDCPCDRGIPFARAAADSSV